MSSKNIIVFGATGRTGFQIVKRGLERGHKVTAFVRDPAKFTLIHPNLKVVKGDALIQQDVSKSMAGANTVVNALSSDEASHRLVFINNIINAMREHQIKRVIAIGGIGALQASEHLKVYETTTFPKEYIDVTQAHVRVLDALLTSRNEFTFVCPPMIKEGERTGVYKTQDRYPTQGWNILSGDLADFIIKEIDENKFVGRKVGISND